MIAEVKLYALCVKKQAFPSDFGKRSVNATVKKHKMELVKKMVVK